MPAILLIHGAYQGGWIWRPVATLLRARGHEVLAPSLDGCAERAHQLRPGITNETHALELAALVGNEDLDELTLVGTSTGGMVLCRLAELIRERVARVVLADALALLDGERLADVVTRRNPVTTELATGPTLADARDRLFAELDEATRDWALARYSPHPIAVMEQPVRLESFWSLPWNARVVWCRRSQNPPRAHQQRAAQTLGAEWFELDSGHYPMLQHPAALADIIARA
ncbi:MAG: alpha/beta fold hydrolase [Ectothiorhodospiraceae bacterium]|nr:alpha/beta fold hydrolase [Chromatiales bacterium]MCP5154792.1 alpha/beta fold hydrolase [Ectothiorhodospiraceae bacterium]